MIYTDIGHNNLDDRIWLLQGDTMHVIRTGDGVAASGSPWTHWSVWGDEVDLSWHGRFEVLTGRCSVVPPVSSLTPRRPPQELISMLKRRFVVRRFVYFGDGKHRPSTAGMATTR